jgi:hypothetical protein
VAGFFTNAVIASMNLAPPSAPPAPSPAQRQAGYVPSAISYRSVGTFSTTGSAGPAPAGMGGAPPSGAASMPSLATSPMLRTAIKVAPFVAALFFFHKGDNALGGVALAAGVGAVVML